MELNVADIQVARSAAVKIADSSLLASKLPPTVFNLNRGDVYWCTADCGWITGHSYLAYGPLLNGATNVVFEGVPTHPTPARCWEIVDKYQV